jgi:hypothetical protein
MRRRRGRLEEKRVPRSRSPTSSCAFHPRVRALLSLKSTRPVSILLLRLRYLGELDPKPNGIFKCIVALDKMFLQSMTELLASAHSTTPPSLVFRLQRLTAFSQPVHHLVEKEVFRNSWLFILKLALGARPLRSDKSTT